MESAPDGILPRNIAPRRLDRWTSAIITGVLAAVAGIGLSGLVGGQTQTYSAAPTDANGAELRVQMPPVVRNGEFFEIRVSGKVRHDVQDLVLAIPQDLWRDITINSMVPAAGAEDQEGSVFTFHFGPYGAGRPFTYKIDGQVNPLRIGGEGGRIELRDGKTVLASLPARLQVLP